MKKIGLLVVMVAVVMLMSQCNKTPVSRIVIAPPADSVVVNNNIQTIIFTNQILYAGQTKFGFPNLTKAILDSGNVAAYFKHSDSTTWIALPYNDGINSCQVVAPLTVGTMILYTSTTLVKYDFRFDLVKGN